MLASSFSASAPPLIACRYLSCASFSHPTYTPPLLYSRATASGRLLSLFFPLGLADSSGLGGVILVFGDPLFPLSSSLLPRLPIMLWYLWPLASAFLYSHPPCLVLISSLLCVFSLLRLLILFPPSFPFLSFHRWQ